MKVILCISIILWSNYLVSDSLVSGVLCGCSDFKSDVRNSGKKNSADENCADEESAEERYAKSSPCDSGSSYRNFDGSCNNVYKPAMGMAGMPYGRFCHDCYSDALPKSKGAFPLTRSWVEWSGADRELANHRSRYLHSALGPSQLPSYSPPLRSKPCDDGNENSADESCADEESAEENCADEESAEENCADEESAEENCADEESTGDNCADEESAEESCAKPGSCDRSSRYRNFNGSCNNLNRPAMGMAGMPFGRFCHDCYSDGKSALPKSKSGKPLPNARLLSYLLSPEKPFDDDEISQLIQPFGQYVTHDLSLTAGIIGNRLRCCDKDTMKDNLANPRCAPIFIPNRDPVYNSSDTPCISLVRNLNTNDKKCHSPYSSYTPLSAVTAYLDGSMVYGNSEEDLKNIREYSGGRLLAIIRNGLEWPPQRPDSSIACPDQSASDPCYMSGDVRVNQTPQLALIHVVYFREHNRLCKELSILNPTWDDEAIFQAARRIVIAIIQHITYNHYLPELLGYDMAVNKKLIYPDNHGWVDDYDNCVDVSSMVEAATGAFRFYHTMVHGETEMYDAYRHKTSSIFLRNSYFRTAILEQGSNFADLARGCAYQPVRMSDQYSDLDITIFLFRTGNRTLGDDLRAIDIQRARDHGVCTYVEVRKTCGLPVPTSFCDLLSYGISQENVDILEECYECVEDLELTVVGILEPLVPGTRAGETFLCVLAEQFLRTRTGDRYFYQNGQDHVSFTLDQLKAIQTGTSISRLFCDNVPSITAMQRNGFRQISSENEYTPCDQLPIIDLQYWKDSEC